MKGNFIQVVTESGYYDCEDENELKEYLTDLYKAGIEKRYIFNSKDNGYISYDELQELPDDDYAVLYQEDDGSFAYYQRADINVNKEQIEKILSQKLTKDWETEEDLTKKCAYIYRMADAEVSA